MIGIYEQLDWLTKRVKKLCCAIETINTSVETINANLEAEKEANPCYVEILLNKAVEPVTSIISFQEFFSLIDGTSQFFTSSTPIYTDTNSVTGYRLYGGKNLSFVNLGTENQLGGITSVNDPCGIITNIVSRLFRFTEIAYVNLPGITEISVNQIFESVANDMDSLYINMPNLETITGDDIFTKSCISEFRAPKLTSIIGSSNFRNCQFLKVIYTPMLNTIGSTDCVTYEFNFDENVGITMTFTLKGSLMTCNAGSPEADLAQLLALNTVTLITT